MLRHVEHVLGAKLPTCPWQAFSDPAVRDVLAAYHSCQTGTSAAQIALVRLKNPPRYVWQGLEHYDNALNAVRLWDERQERAKNPR